MRLVFAGTPVAAVVSLEALLSSRHEVAAVVTRPDAAAGRGLKSGPSPVARRAAEAGVEILRPARPRDPEFVARLTELAPDCCPVTAYGALIPDHVLEIPAHGWVNLHFSILPAWRGAAPVPHAILHGDDMTGATMTWTPGPPSACSPSRSGTPTPPARCWSGSAWPVPSCWSPPWT
jgi:methionyl-tRNA formyltransferase